MARRGEGGWRGWLEGSVREAVYDRLIVALALALAVLLASGRLSLGDLAVYLRPGVLASLAGLMAAGAAALDSGYPQALVARVLAAEAPAGLLLALAAVSGGLLASLLTNDASLFLTMPMLMALVGASSCLDPTLAAAVAAASANIGSALTPIGNPQNMLVASHYRVGFAGFTEALAPLALTGLAITALIAMLAAPNCRVRGELPRRTRRVRPLLAGAASLVLVTWGIDAGEPLLGGLLGLATAVALYPRSLRGVNLATLLTIGLLLADFQALSAMLGELTARAASSGLATYIHALLLSQAVSNVPAAAMLCGKTPHWEALAYGVDAGGNLAVWSSLANIIGYRLAASLSVKRRVSLRAYQAYILLMGTPTAVLGALYVKVM